MATENRLARNALTEGYSHLADLSIPDTHRVERRSESVAVTGRIEDNVIDLVKTAADLVEAYREGSASRVHALGFIWVVDAA